MILAGRTALVTGGASGLGEACVRALVAAQASVTIADLNEARGQALAAELGPLTQFCRTDVCDEGDVLAALDEGERLDMVIHCAGVATAERALGKDGPLDLDRFTRVMNINVTGTLAFDGQIGQAASAASKGAVASMTLPLAREFARFGIRVLSIAPGLFRTPLLAGLPEEAMKQLAATIPFPSRLGDPAEFASLALHMIQNRMLNGEVVRLDGALRMAPR
ncbi:MAG: SDR family oxidoreductase [Acidobacteria bacterium]|nr:SDR family oxidoreductase [Acidobacteriota bacterium]